MGATIIQDALPGEDLVGIEPALLQQVDPGWLHRLHLYSGRTLTAPALQSEQLYRAGRLAILGQCVTQGVVKGLELSADLTKADPLLQVGAGLRYLRIGRRCQSVQHSVDYAQPVASHRSADRLVRLRSFRTTSRTQPQQLRRRAAAATHHRPGERTAVDTGARPHCRLGQSERILRPGPRRVRV